MGAGASAKKKDKYVQLEDETQERPELPDLPTLPWRQEPETVQVGIEGNGDIKNNDWRRKEQNASATLNPTIVEAPTSQRGSRQETTLNPSVLEAPTSQRGPSKESREDLESASTDRALDHASTPANQASLNASTGARQWIVVASWHGENEDQLSVQEGDTIEVLQLKGPWVLCRANGKDGLVPRKNLKQTQNRAPGGTARVASARNQKIFTQEAPLEPRKVQPNISEKPSIIDSKLQRGHEARKDSRRSSNVADPDMPELTRDWTSKLTSTMTLHTIQNTIRLAHYLMELLTNGFGTASALHMAAWEGSVDAVVALTSGSSAICKKYHSRQGELTPLHIATLCRHSGVLEHLLQMDVNVDIATVHGLRALHIAAFTGPELTELLLDAKAFVDPLTIDHDTPLHVASCYNQVGTVEVLLKAGASVGLANNFGTVPLHILAAHSAMAQVPLRDARGILLLTSKSADPSARDKHEKTPHSVALKVGGDTSLLDFLGTTLIKAQQIAAEYLGDDEDMVSDNEPTPEHSEDEADANGGEEASLPTFGSGDDKRKAKAETARPSTTSGQDGLRLAGENAALVSEIDKLRKELESSKSNVRLLQERLDNAQATVKTLQDTQTQKVVVEASSSDDSIRQQVKQELEACAQERADLLSRQDKLEEERQVWNAEKESLQQNLKDAEDSRDKARLESEKLKVERDTLSSKVINVADANKVAAETAAESSSRMQSELNEKSCLIDEKIAELSAMRSEAEKKDNELEEASKTIASQTSEVSRLEASNSRLSDELSRKSKQFEETWKSLSDLKQKYSALESSSQEKALGLESDLRDKGLQIQKLETDNADQSLRLQEIEVMKERVEYANRMLKPLEDRIQELHDAFAAEQALRKRYHNQLQDAKGAIRVYARVRPVVPREAGQAVVVHKMDAFSMDLEGNDKARKNKTYTFDSIFDDHSSQEDVFNECRSLVSSTIDGFNVTVFAYGQTGAGKTHTMYGNPNQPGLVPRIVEEIFAVVGKYSHDNSSRVLISMFELYCNDLVDLLAPKNKASKDKKQAALASLEIKKDSRGSVFVENATQLNMATSEQLLKSIDEGSNRRHVAATKMNADSSRSHLIVILVVESTNKKTKQVTTGKLTLCDLAGSERLKKSEVTGEQKKEAQAINMSLTALGDVIEALSKNAKHIPYRNHKLTQLLSDSIGGNAKTLMFVNCSPVADNGDETHAALNYAARAKLIVNKVEKNQDSQEVARLKKVVQMMSQELEQIRGPNHTGAPNGFDQPFLEGDRTEEDEAD